MALKQGRRSDDLEQRTARVIECLRSGNLTPDEADIILTVAERVIMGQGLYGPLVLKNDQRDFGREGFEEMIDGLVYACAAFRRVSDTQPAPAPTIPPDTFAVGPEDFGGIDFEPDGFGD